MKSLARKKLQNEVSAVLGPSTIATEVKISEEKELSCSKSSGAQDVVTAIQDHLIVVLLLIAPLTSRLIILNNVERMFENCC